MEELFIWFQIHIQIVELTSQLGAQQLTSSDSPLTIPKRFTLWLWGKALLVM